MRAAVQDAYGGPEVVRIAEIPRPEPRPGEVLIRAHATTVATGDWRMRSATVPDGFGLIGFFLFARKPRARILGTELAGVIEAVGQGVTEWNVGDEVFAFPGGKMGAHAEFVPVRAERVARKPANLSFETAAALCFGGSTALSFIEKAGGLHPGQRVLVVGASGSVGSAMVQLAKHFGTHVTAVCSTANIELVRGLGADEAIDYTQTDFTTSSETYDIIVDTTASIPSAKARPRLAPGGRFLVINGSMGDLLRSIFSRQIIAGPADEDPAHLPKLADLAEAGVLNPLIDEVFAFDDITEAHRRVDTGRKRGNVVVSLE
ncbi:MAG: NAD(P)-dependent alcohol dehydrogenase [Myxococcota bacterium]